MRGWSIAAFAFVAALTLSAPGAAFAQDPGLIARIQTSVSNGQRLVNAGRPEAAEPLFRSAAEAAVTLWGEGSPDAGALTYLWAQSVDLQPNRAAEAERLYRLCIARFEAWGDLMYEHPQAVLAVADLAANLHGQGKYQEALAMHDRAVFMTRQFSGEGEALNSVMSNRAVTLRTLGRFDEADAAYRLVLASREATLDPDDPALGLTWQNIGVNLMQMDRKPEAEAAFRRAVTIRETSLGADDPLTAQSVYSLGSVLGQLGRLDAARSMLERSIAVFQPGRDDDDLGVALGTLSGILLAQGDLAGAEAAQRRAIAVQEASIGPDHPETATGRIGLGDILLMQGRAAEAEPELRRGIAALESAIGADNPDLAEPLFLLAVAIGETGKREDAIAVFRRAQAVTASLPESHLTRIGAEANLGSALAANREPRIALPLLRHAGRALIEKSGQRAAVDQGARLELDGYRMVYRLTVTAAWDAAEGL